MNNVKSCDTPLSAILIAVVVLGMAVIAVISHQPQVTVASVEAVQVAQPVVTNTSLVNASFYLHSTIAQVLAAVFGLAIIAVFSLLKLLSNRVKKLEDDKVSYSILKYEDDLTKLKREFDDREVKTFPQEQYTVLQRHIEDELFKRKTIHLELLKKDFNRFDKLIDLSEKYGNMQPSKLKHLIFVFGVGILFSLVCVGISPLLTHSAIWFFMVADTSFSVFAFVFLGITILGYAKAIDLRFSSEWSEMKVRQPDSNSE